MTSSHIQLQGWSSGMGKRILRRGCPVTFDSAVGWGAGEGQGSLKEEQDWGQTLVLTLLSVARSGCPPTCLASYSVQPLFFVQVKSSRNECQAVLEGKDMPRAGSVRQ